MTVLRQNFCNISSISKGRNDFTHHQLKDYDVFSVKKLEIRPTEKSASKIPKVRGGSETFGKNSYLSHHFYLEVFPKCKKSVLNDHVKRYHSEQYSLCYFFGNKKEPI